LRGLKGRVNLLVLNNRDCFAPLAMTSINRAATDYSLLIIHHLLSVEFLYINIGKLDMVAMMLQGDWAAFG